MKTAQRLVFACLALVPLGVVPALPAQEASGYSLEEAFRRANEANFDLLLGRESVEAAVQAERRQRAGLLPQVTAEAGQGRAQSFFDLGNFGGEGQVFPISNSFDARLRARLSLFDVNTHADHRVAKFNTEIARLELDRQVQDIHAAIAEIYFTHLRNLRQADTIEAQIARDRVLLDLATKRAEAGTATVLDVTRAEVRLAANELRLSQQETIIFESALNFERVLNLPLDGSVELAPLGFDDGEPVRFSLAELEAVQARRPEVVSARRALARNELAQKAANFEWLPSAELSGSYGRSGETAWDTTGEVWSIQLGLSMPLFEGFRIDANQREAASAVRAQTVAVAQVETQVEADYRLALSQVNTTVRSIAIGRRQVALAEKELDLAKRRFEEGVADNSEVVDAQASLAEAEDGLVGAQYQYHLARLALARAQGDVYSLALP